MAEASSAAPEHSPAPDHDPGRALIDAHHHLWDPARRAQPWHDAPGHEPLRRAFTTTDLAGAAAAGLLGRALRASVVVQCLNELGETRELLAIAADDPLVAGVVGWVDLTRPDVGDHLDALRAGAGGGLLVGVRHLVQSEPDPRWLLREDVAAGLAAVAERGLSFDLLVIGSPQIDAAAELARRAPPDLRLVLDHAGKPPVREREGLAAWRASLRELAAPPQVTCKFSGLITEADWEGWSVADLAPVADALLEAFGPSRLMFGSDWPVCVLAGGWSAWAGAAAELLAALSEAELDDVLVATAASSYQLEVPPC